MESNPALIPIQYEWKISEEQLKNLRDNPNLPEFFIEEKEIMEISGLKFKLEIQYCEDGMATIFFFSTGLKDKVYSVNYLFNVKSANFKTVFRYGTFDNNASYDDDICSIEDLFNPEKKFIVNGEFIIEMKGFLYERKLFNEKPESQKSLAQFLWDRDDKDFTIVVGKEGDNSKTEIKIHKCVLAARSPVFDRMIQTNMKEKKEGKVEIIDFDAEIVQTAVKYFYDQDGSEFYENIKNIISLFLFADKYDIQDFKSKVERVFSEKISPSNICEISNAAVLTNSSKLRDFCFQTMLSFSKLKLSVENMIILDKDFAFELLQKTFTFE